MTSLESSDFWRGVFTPMQKHRHHPKTKHPDHLIDHILVDGMTMLDDDEIEAYDEDIENDYGYDQLTQLGSGPVPYIVRIRFIGDEQDKYDYVLHLSESDDVEQLAKEAKELVADDLTPR